MAQFTHGEISIGHVLGIIKLIRWYSIKAFKKSARHKTHYMLKL